MKQDGLSARSRERRKRLVANRATSFAEAERWDLQYWQSLSPRERIAALESMRREWEEIRRARDR